ncbi:MAG: leucyl/phenylalanyl-tRNA--protein transferase [Desulfobulbaceae bacterium]
MPLFQLGREILFPDPELAEPDGLLAIGGDLSSPRLLEAYRMGIFPWFGEGDPILWWSPAPRLILFPDEFHLPRRLVRSLRKNTFTFSADTAFESVITRCANFRGKNRTATWITESMRSAYIRLHEQGYAHSIECWQQGRLAGGLYGVCLDRVFFGESMFSDVTDASKAALKTLVECCRARDIEIIDCQVRTEHLSRFGAREISRPEFQSHLKRLIRTMKPQEKWRLVSAGKEETGRPGAI